MEDAAKENGEANVFWSFVFEIPPTGIPGADRDILEDTQEADDANGNTPAYSLNTWNKFASKVIQEMFHPECCHCLGNSIRKSDKGVGYTEVFEDQILGP